MQSKDRNPRQVSPRVGSVIVFALTVVMWNTATIQNARACSPNEWEGRTSAIEATPTFEDAANCLTEIPRPSYQIPPEMLVFANDCDEAVELVNMDCEEDCTTLLEVGESHRLHNPIAYMATPSSEPESASSMLLWSTSSGQGAISFHTDYEPPPEGWETGCDGPLGCSMSSIADTSTHGAPHLLLLAILVGGRVRIRENKYAQS